MKTVITFIISALCISCQQPSSYKEPDQPPKEYTIEISVSDLERLQNNEAVNLNISYFDENIGVRRYIRARTFSRQYLETIFIFIPPSNSPLRTPENPVPRNTAIIRGY